MDPCGALSTRLTLRPGEETELVFLLGESESKGAVVALIEHYRAADLDEVFKTVTEYWSETLGVVQVKTPDRGIDILLNGWLLYQTLACRMWSRTGFYQARRRLWLPRSIAGFDGAVPVTAGAGARTHAARRRAAIRGRATCSIGGCRRRGTA